ncbi:MAG: hypothetical protein FWD15_04865 [Alphaproteobacteria bacterium]|nr:hypothetical protein [Alphaproteobacteria bacterium]
MSAINVRGTNFIVREELIEFVQQKIRELMQKHRLGLVWSDVVFMKPGEGKIGAEISIKIGTNDYFAKTTGSRAVSAFTKTLRLIAEQINKKDSKSKAARRN